MKGIYESFFMANFKKLFSREIPAISIFCFLIGVLIVIILRTSFSSIVNYVDVFAHQIKDLQISEHRVLLTVLCNRLLILLFVFAGSYFYKGKYSIYILAALFFLLYGIFLALNCLALGIKGILTGFLLIIPQWICYLLGFALCIYQNFKITNNRRGIKIVGKILPFILIFLGSIIESYVTQPLVFKFF